MSMVTCSSEEHVSALATMSTSMIQQYQAIIMIFIISVIIISVMAPTFWDEHEAANFAFQESQLLNIITDYSQNMYHKLPCHTSSLGGKDYIQELITTAHPRRCQKVFRMPLETFLVLRNWLTEYTPLKESCKHFSVQQKLTMFLYIAGKGAFNHTVQEKFQHSGDTVSHVFHEVLSSLLYLHAETVNLPTKDDVLHPRIADDTKYFPYFQDCLSALDGTHISAHVLAADGAAYRNRKGVLSQNALGVCTMDIQFCYVLTGWEGSAHDDKDLEDTLFNKDFIIPGKKYYSTVLVFSW